MSPRSAAEAWEDVPLFGAELLLGPHTMTDKRRGAIHSFLREVARSRTAPLHAATAWNALYFGYDLRQGTYCGIPDHEGFVDVRNAACPLPVGAFVRYERGTHLIWGEVVASFGDAPEARDDPMGGLDPAWHLPGPRDVHTGAVPPAAFDELTVVDWHSIADLDERQKAELRRARRRPSPLDASGHVRGRREHARLPAAAGVPHGDAESVPVDALAAYAHHLMRHHHPLVRRGFFADILHDPGNTEILHGALLSSLLTVAELLAETPGLVCWSGYAVPEERYAARRRSEDLLGGDDLRELARILSRADDRPRRLAVIPALDGLINSSHQKDQRESVFAEVALAESVVQANLFLAEHARLARDSKRLRLVDDWQTGGIWETSLAPAENDTPPDDDAETAALTAEPGDVPTESDALDDELAELLAQLASAPDTMTVGRTVTLSTTDVADGMLPLPAGLVTALGKRRRFRVELHQTGTSLLPVEAVQPATLESEALRLVWPLTVTAGAQVVVGVPATGTRLRIDIVERVSAEPGQTTDQARQPPEPPARLRQIILDRVRQAGTLGPGGSRSLTGDVLRQDVATAWEKDGAVTPLDPRDFALACTNLVTDRRLQVTAGTPITPNGVNGTNSPAAQSDSAIVHRGPDTYTWWPHGVWDAPSSDPQAEAASSGFVGAVKGPHYVPGFVRQLPAGARASRRARDDYAAWARAHGHPTELPPGTTFVRGHHRGQEDVLGQAMEFDQETR